MSGRNILIVEPNPGILIVGRNVLARAGFHVLAVSSVDEGLLEAKRHPLDVVLLDGKLSEPELLINFARSRARGVPIILTVQKGRDVITIEALEAGGWSELVDIADVIEKPFAPDRLLQAVDKAVQRSSERTDPSLRIEVDRLFVAEDIDDLDVEDTMEHERTERYQPFEALLSMSDERTDSHEALVSPVISVEGSAAERHARLRMRIKGALAQEGLRIQQHDHEAVVRVCERVLDDERFFSGDDLRPGDLALAGYIDHLPLDHVLQLAASVTAPSRLRLEHEDQAIEIYFKHGQVVFARQERLHEGFMLGRFLVSLGAVHQRDVERAISAQHLDGWIGQRLLANGFIRETDLTTALKRQTEELVYEAVRWNAGRFAVFAREGLPAEAEAAEISFPVAHLLLEGMRRLDEWRRMAGEVGGLRSVIDRLDRSDEPSVIASLRPEERMLLEQVDGRRTVEDLVRSVRRPTYDVFKALHNLRGQRLVTVVAETAATA
jgi:DNA-binding response OmpR family regulator